MLTVGSELLHSYSPKQYSYSRGAVIYSFLVEIDSIILYNLLEGRQRFNNDHQRSCNKRR